MTSITIVRTDRAMPSNLDSARDLLFGALDGANKDDKRAWRRFWARLLKLETGELAFAEMRFPRSGPYHRRHMAIEAAVFDAQERFKDFDQFRVWLKVGAGFVDWCAGPKGGVVPIPRSISYSKADQEEFTRFHELTMAFLRGPHAAPYLWKHLGDKAHETMDDILLGFEE